MQRFHFNHNLTNSKTLLFFRLSLANAVYENPSLPRRKILLSTGGQNYRPPLERSKSAPKLSAIEEDTVAEEIEQKRLLEEIRSLESVARSWQDQDGWRLARLLDVLNRESSDENGSISSGCETASTANSEERASSSEDSHIPNESDPRSKRKVFFADDVLIVNGPGPRRNSDGSLNFMTCAASPRFRRKSAGRKSFSSRSEGEESMEEEEEEELEDPRSTLFEFDDVEDFEEIVDYRPRGENPRRLENLQKRKAGVEKYPGRVYKELRDGEDTFLILDSLDEEADSDESGYVEAPPKSLIDQPGGKDPLIDQTDGQVSLNTKEIVDPQLQVQRKEAQILRTESSEGDSSPEIKLKVSLISNSTPKEEGRNQEVEELDLKSNDVKEYPKAKENERQDFIQCPISETIKKLANATLRSSKSLDMSNKSCLKVLKTSKSFEGSKTLDIESESPSLHQRKQLLAKQGVTV